ncbi:PAS domain S-box protein, partial [Cyanothece sp. BG0011]|uniref:PAS domain S-box protein n=1 Tax=Cyanothece sp. BG0011 TaxID=2082950 RepID=UPI0018E54F75
MIDQGDQQRIKQAFDSIKSQANQSIILSEFRVSKDDNGWVMLEAIAKNLQDDPAVAGFVINCHDITERHYTAQQLRYDAYHDKLTGLANRS